MRKNYKIIKILSLSILATHFLVYAMEETEITRFEKTNVPTLVQLAARKYASIYNKKISSDGKILCLPDEVVEQIRLCQNHPYKDLMWKQLKYAVNNGNEKAVKKFANFIVNNELPIKKKHILNPDSFEKDFIETTSDSICEEIKIPINNVIQHRKQNIQEYRSSSYVGCYCCIVSYAAISAFTPFFLFVFWSASKSS